MKQKCFSGIAVHAHDVSCHTPTIVGVCLLRRQLLPREKSQILAYRSAIRGKIGVRQNPSGTTSVIYLGRLANAGEARKVAHFLARVVARITGHQAITRRLRDFTSVSQALAT